jgi:hypothetical protein
MASAIALVSAAPAQAVDAANDNIEDVFCGDVVDSLTGDDWDAEHAFDCERFSLARGLQLP